MSPQQTPLPRHAPPEPIPQELESRLASYMTHELRAPLTAVRSALTLLNLQLGQALGAEQRRILSIAAKNADRLNGLINDIMDFSKIRAGRLKMGREPIAAPALLQEAVDSLRAWALAKGVRLTRAPDLDPLPRACGDPRRALQILINIVSNGIKFTPVRGKVEVSASLGRHQDLGFIVFQVKDSGPGIPASELESVFHCFEQSALGAKSSGGTGLGLTLAKAMTELQGGRIWAESWRGLGARVYFTLPILPADLTQPVPKRAEPIEIHGLLAPMLRRLNAFVGALFA